MKWPVPEEPYQAAARLWARKHGKATDKCTEQAKNARYRILNDGQMKYSCQRAEAPAACMQASIYSPDSDPIIDLADTPRGLSYSVRVHELLHVFLWCAGLGAEDGVIHKDEVWSLVPPDELPKESPWYRTPIPKLLRDELTSCTP